MQIQHQHDHPQQLQCFFRQSYAYTKITKDNKDSPIYGMPIVEVDRSKTVIVLKRSMASGFAGIQNPLFFKQNTRMLFGDAKESVSSLVAEFKA